MVLLSMLRNGEIKCQDGEPRLISPRAILTTYVPPSWIPPKEVREAVEFHIKHP
jgi:hypothetical protein